MLKPPPRDGRAGHVSLHGVAPDRVYSDGLFPAIGQALTSAFPSLPYRQSLQGGISLLHFSWGRPRRVLPVILALRSPDFPHRRAFRPARAAVQLTCLTMIPEFSGIVKSFSDFPESTRPFSAFRPCPPLLLRCRRCASPGPAPRPRPAQWRRPHRAA